MIDRFNKYAFLIPLALLVAVLIHSCRNIEPVTITKIESVSVGDFNNEGATFKVSLGIKNPNNIRFKVKEGDLNFFLNEHQVGRVKIEDKIVIPKRSDKVYTVDIKAGFSNISLSAIPGILSAVKNRKADVGIKGDIHVKAFGVRKKFPVDLKEKVDLDKYVPKM